MRKMLTVISTFIALLLWFLGIGGVLSPILQPTIINSVVIFLGMFFILIGSFLRKISLRSVNREARSTIMTLDALLIMALQSVSIVVDLALNIQQEVTPIPKLFLFLISIIGYVKLRKVVGKDTTEPLFYTAPIYLSVILCLIYIPAMIIYNADMWFVSIIATMISITVSMSIYEIFKIKKLASNMPESLKFILRKTLVIILSIIAFIGFGIAREIGRDVAKIFSRDGITREERASARYRNKKEQEETEQLDAIATNIEIEPERDLDKDYESYENLSNAENINNTIQIVQIRLTFKGYYDGEIDGLMGEMTEKALMEYQKGWTQFPTGKLNVATLVRLGIIE